MVYIETNEQGHRVVVKFKSDIAVSLTPSQDTIQWTVPDGVCEIEYFIVGGGGGTAGIAGGSGYNSTPGGGGGGGVLEGVLSVERDELLTIKIGAGGKSTAYDVAPGKGSNTELRDLIAYGGAIGSSYFYKGNEPSGCGGGGTASYDGSKGPSVGYAGPPRQGYDGGIAIWDTSYHCGAGGGGGAGGAGLNATSLYIAGNGGPGRLCSLDGNYYGGGGGGGIAVGGTKPGIGGIGGGSAAPAYNTVQTVPGTPCTGGGCGANGKSIAPANNIGGGSGIVILRYTMPKILLREGFEWL